MVFVTSRPSLYHRLGNGCHSCKRKKKKCDSWTWHDSLSYLHLYEVKMLLILCLMWCYCVHLINDSHERSTLIWFRKKQKKEVSSVSNLRGNSLSIFSHLKSGNCVVSLSMRHLSLLSTGSTQEDPPQHNWKIVDWDVKNQIKQTKQNKIRDTFALWGSVNSVCWVILNAFLSSAYFFSKWSFFNKFFQEYHQSVDGSTVAQW